MIQVKEFTIDDIFLIADIVSKTDILNTKFEGENETEIGMSIIKIALKSSAKVKKDLYQLISNITEIPVTQVKALTFTELKEIIKQVKEVNDLKEVFTQAKEMI